MAEFVQGQHQDEAECSDAIIDAVNEATHHGQWMIAVWIREDNGRVRLVRRTTCRFETGDFDVAINQLKQLCDAERKNLGEIQTDDPLPPAPFLKMADMPERAFTKEEPKQEEPKQ